MTFNSPWAQPVYKKAKKKAKKAKAKPKAKPSKPKPVKKKAKKVARKKVAKKVAKKAKKGLPKTFKCHACNKRKSKTRHAIHLTSTGAFGYCAACEDLASAKRKKKSKTKKRVTKKKVQPRDKPKPKPKPKKRKKKPSNEPLWNSEVNWLAQHGWSSAQIASMSPSKAREYIAAGLPKKPGTDTKAAVGDVSLTSTGALWVQVRCVRADDKIRVRPVPGQGYDASMNVQFPKHLRHEGCRYVVDDLVLNKKGTHYRAVGEIRPF